MASELYEGSTDNHTVRRYTLTITVAVSPHRALTVIIRRTAYPALPKWNGHTGDEGGVPPVRPLPLPLGADGILVLRYDQERT